MPGMILSMSPKLTMTETSDAVNDLGWRFILGTLRTSVPVQSLTQAAQVTADAVAACGLDTDQHLRADLRPGRVVLTLQSLDEATVTTRDIELANAITAAAAAGPEDALIDPLGQGPAIWFQQMDEPRTQRNRLHFDVSVPHDEAARRIEATLAAGGKLTYDAEAPAFWVLADPE